MKKRRWLGLPFNLVRIWFSLLFSFAFWVVKEVKWFVLERVVGYHLLELLLWISRLFRKERGGFGIVSLINWFYQKLFFDSPKQRCGKSVDIFNFDRPFRQKVNEWAISSEKTAEAMVALRSLLERERIQAEFPVEVRFVKGDDKVWLSPCYGMKVACYISIIIHKPFNSDIDLQYELSYFKSFEDIMLSFRGRPHWAKGFYGFDPKLSYPKWDSFLNLRQLCDPNSIFVNPYIQRLLS